MMPKHRGRTTINVSKIFQPCVSSKLQSKALISEITFRYRGISYLQKFLLCNRFRTLEQAPANTAICFGIFFMSHVRPILAALALFSHDTHAAISRDPEFQVGFRERSSLPPIAIMGHL